MEVEEPSFWQQEWFWNLMKQLAAGLFVLLLILGVLRPILRSLANAGKAREVDTLGPAGEISADLEGLEGADVADDKVTSAGLIAASWRRPTKVSTTSSMRSGAWLRKIRRRWRKRCGNG